MTELVSFHCLDVGQGLGVFIELFDNSAGTGAPTHTMLNDLGSLGGHAESADPSADWIAERLNEMTQPTIDALFISHGDRDHFNRIFRVLDDFKPYNPKAGVSGKGTLRVRYCLYSGSPGKFYIGGREGKKRKLLKKLTEYMKHNDSAGDKYAPSAAPDGACSFDNAATEAVRTVNNTVRAYILTGNNTTGRYDRARNKDPLAPVSKQEENSRSMVMVFRVMGTQFVATGDATCTSMLKCNQNIADKVPDEHYIDNIFAVTVPHHGAYKTAFDLEGTDAGDDSAGKVVLKFTDNLKPKSSIASSGYRNKHKHPDARLLRFFWMLPQGEEPNWYDRGLEYRHLYTAFFAKRKFTRLIADPDDPDDPDETLEIRWPPKKNWYSVQTAVPIFTSVYYARRYNQFRRLVLPTEPGWTADTAVTAFAGQPLTVHWTYEVRTAPSGKPNLTMNRANSRDHAFLAGALPAALSAPVTAGTEPADLRQPAPMSARPIAVARPAAGMTGRRAAAAARQASGLGRLRELL